ncbi:MAG: AMP-binding protein [Prevotella sp.]|nr:AMP-binding protein [Prevotella sp.]
MTLEEFLEEWNSPSATVLVHTSGSTGEPKPMLVEKSRMEASARITCRFLGLKPGSTALLCLPLDYIAGKMMVVRALTFGLKLQAIEPKGMPVWQGRVDLAAMVPLQVYNLLKDEDGRRRLMQTDHLLIGGGPVDDALAHELAAFPNHVWSTYGMTETLSHIALRRLNGPEATEWYTPLEGVSVSLNSDDCLVVNAPAVCPVPLVTNDIAQLRDGTFRILGRRDNVVCSGGMKIQIEEVERLLRPHLAIPFMITKAQDKKLGEQVVLLAEDENAEADSLLALCRQVLPKYYVPRSVVAVSRLPMTATGKPARKEAERIARGATAPRDKSPEPPQSPLL